MKIVQYRIVIAEFYNVLQMQVNDAIGLGWQPTGQLLHAEFQLNPENMNTPRIRKAFAQAMVLPEGATAIEVPPPPAPLTAYPQTASGVYPPPATPPLSGGS